ncbi:MAG: DUF5110 domain-containing protein [Clostridia bacterium]|nr:DUF5110 domain-containing protein [Clostridia bacterium]
MEYNRFKWQTNGKAIDENIVVCNNARFTVLTDRLIRIEYDLSGKFIDKASQFAFNRNFPKTDFSVFEDDFLIIETEFLKLKYVPDCVFSEETISIDLKKYGRQWKWGDTCEQFKGTACTLDKINGATQLEDGVCSRNGYTTVDDSKSYLLSENGWFEKRKSNVTDVYFFGYGHDYLDCIKDFYRLTGEPPMLPDYAFGNWWSRFYSYTQEEYCNLMDKFKDENIPFSVAVIDMDWHTVETPKECLMDDPRCWNGWTGYSWNKKLFPDYKAFLSDLKKKGLKTSLNLHPSNGIGYHEDMYEEMAKACGIDPKSRKLIKLDVLNPDFMEKYFDILHHPYEADGVDFWWMDWQQGNDYWWVHDEEHPESDLEGITPLWMLNHLHILDIMRNGKRPMFFSRYAGLGSHRYPVGFSGDTVTTWESLDFQPYFTANASNAGYGWWSHDIGGHMLGYRDDELQIRWLQLGVLSPINRLHSTKDIFAGKEPWNLRKDLCEIYKEWLRFRHKLFPYLYTMNYCTYNELKPLILPMYYYYPECDNAYKCRNQYFFGSEFFVAPITAPNNKNSELGSVDVWFPEGLWFDFFSGLCYKGNQTLKVHRNLEEYPIFAKAGAIIPTASNANDNALGNKSDMTVDVFAGGNNTFNLYEDKGDGSNFKNGEYVITEFKLSWGEKAVFTVNAAQGNTEIIPEFRNWNIKLRGFAKDIKLIVRVDGKETPCETVYDLKSNTTAVVVENVSVSSEIAVEITGENLITDNEGAVDRFYDILLHSQMDYVTKANLWYAFKDKNKLLYKQCPQKEYSDILNAAEEMGNLLGFM